MVPDELLMTLADQWPCRDIQIRQFTSLLSPTLPTPSTVIVHGPEASGKTGVTKSYLQTSGVIHAFVPCGECITGRHLLERTLSACVDAVKPTNGNSNHASSSKCESLSALTSSLERVLEGIDKFILVLDGVDEQREAPPTMLPALTRLGQIIPSLTVVLIVTHPHPRLLHSPGVPHVYFPPYNREQAVQILSVNPPAIFLDPPPPQIEYTETLQAEDNLWIWARFCAAVWDSLAIGAARDIVSFRSIAEKLWRPFVQPIVDGNFGTRDFSRLLVSQRKLFQAESALLDSVIEDTDNANMATSDVTHDLPHYSKWLLCAAYLASFNPARQDALYFMKATERRRRKKGGGTAARRETKSRKIPRHLLSPSPFPLDRLFAILHAILPHDFVPTMDIYTQLATLCSLRLLLRTAVVGGDILESGVKWKVNFGWDYAVKIARSVGLDLTDYAAE
ncbi:origin recognition complex subunit 5 C-terminus-domain-containing protein [Delphinella strobiligena]|nr:origin recognition complex subunit 5 C-terminus-domain-containing protein [Delphinella strobiligena]